MGPNQTKSYKANSIIYLKAGGYSSLVWNFSVLVHCNGSVTPTVLWVALLSQFFQGYSTPQVLSEIILAPYETRGEIILSPWATGGYGSLDDLENLLLSYLSFPWRISHFCSKIALWFSRRVQKFWQPFFIPSCFFYLL